jgi:hypothetical protein
LTKLGEAATFAGLTIELEVEEHLDAAITKCLKELLQVRGVKSLAATLLGGCGKKASSFWGGVT